MEKEVKIKVKPRVLVLATPEFYPNYVVAFEKLDRILTSLKEQSKLVTIVVDSSLKATKLIQKYTISREFGYDMFVPNIRAYKIKREKMYEAYINLAIDYLVVFHYGDTSEFYRAINPAVKKGIPIRFIDLRLCETE